jgi:hypothetical protein
MTTSLTASEIKMIYIQIIVMAILGTTMFLYVQTPIQSSPAITSSAGIQTSVSSSGSWINTLLGIPEGMGELFFISALIISPFLVMDTFIAIRFVKDIATGWI